jgi:hypothetical protein
MFHNLTDVEQLLQKNPLKLIERISIILFQNF